MKVKAALSFFSILLLCGLFLLTGCNKNKNTQENIFIPTAFLPIATQSEIDEPYPSTPEEVIREFLIIYPGFPEAAIKYLSPAYVQRLDEVSVLNLLPESGEVNGFIINQGSSSAESERSELQISLAYGMRTYELTVDFAIQEGRWVIEKIVNTAPY